MSKEALDQFLLATADITAALNELVQNDAKKNTSTLEEKFPNMFKVEGLVDKERVEAFHALQAAVTVPYLGAAVNIALNSDMSLPDFLQYVGIMWERMRAQMLAKVSEEILNKGIAKQHGES